MSKELDSDFEIKHATECARCEFCGATFLLFPGSKWSDLDAVRKLCFICTFCDKGFTGDVFEGAYREYLRTPIWKALRDAALDRAGKRCQVCNSDLMLQVHHRKYPEVLGTESPMDLTVLCRRCHDLFHNVTARGTR